MDEASIEPMGSFLITMEIMISVYHILMQNYTACLLRARHIFANSPMVNPAVLTLRIKDSWGRKMEYPNVEHLPLSGRIELERGGRQLWR